MHRSFFLAVCVIVTWAAEAAGQVVEFEIHNLSNADVFVAQAFNKGADVSGGWTVLKPSDKRTFKSDWAKQPCLRVEQDGREVTFRNFEKFIPFPATQQRFIVTNTDNPMIRTLKWGEKLERVFNMRAGDDLPDTWGVVRFFTPPTPGKHHLEILP